MTFNLAVRQILTKFQYFHTFVHEAFAHTVQLFDRENIDGQHPRPPVLAVATGNY